MPRETPVGSFWVQDSKQPTTPIQALMEAAPGEDPATSSMEDASHALSDVIQTVMAEFDEDERDILTMHVMGLSVRDIASNVGWSKDRVHRNLPGLMEALTDKFKNNPEIMEYINGSET